MSNKKKTKLPIVCKSPKTLVNRERKDFKDTNVLVLVVAVEWADISFPVYPLQGFCAIVLVGTDCFLDVKKDDWYEGTTLFD